MSGWFDARALGARARIRQIARHSGLHQRQLTPGHTLAVEWDARLKRMGDVIEALASVEMLGPAVRAAGEESFEMVVPAMKIKNFHFSEVTKF